MITYTFGDEIFYHLLGQALESFSLKFPTHSEEASSKSSYYEGVINCEMGQSNARGCCMRHIKCEMCHGCILQHMCCCHDAKAMPEAAAWAISSAVAMLGIQAFELLESLESLSTGISASHSQLFQHWRTALNSVAAIRWLASSKACWKLHRRSTFMVFWNDERLRACTVTLCHSVSSCVTTKSHSICLSKITKQVLSKITKQVLF